MSISDRFNFFVTFYDFIFNFLVNEVKIYLGKKNGEIICFNAFTEHWKFNIDSFDPAVSYYVISNNCVNFLFYYTTI